MKNVRKRFLSLIMALMMLLSCMAYAYATDVPKATSASDGSIVVVSSSDGNEGIMPLASYHPVYEASRPTSGTTTVKDVTMKPDNQVKLSIASNVEVKVDIYVTTQTVYGDKFEWVRGYKCASTNNEGKVYSLGSGYSHGIYKFVISPTSSGSYTMALGLVY